MITYRVASEYEQKHYLNKREYYSIPFNFQEIFICTRKYLRDKVYSAWKENKSRWFFIQTENPNHIYEGLVINSWSSVPDNPLEDKFSGYIDKFLIHFEISNIIEVSF